MVLFDKNKPTNPPSNKPDNKENKKIPHNSELYVLKMGTKYLQRYNDSTLDLSLTTWIGRAYFFENKKDVQKIINNIGGEIITLKAQQNQEEC